MKAHSSTFSLKVNKSHALSLLKVLQSDIHKSTEKRDRAVVWGKEVQGLTYLEMARAMGYNSQVTIFNIYQRMIGGKS